MNKDYSTRIVVARIKVDPKDSTKCNRRHNGCPAIANNMDCIFGIRKHAGDFSRLPACIAAEVKVDEKNASTAQNISGDDEYWAPEFVNLARAYLALVKVME